MMGNQFNEIMQKLRAQRVRARRYTAMLLVLAMLTSLSVSWRLHQVGTALTTDNEYSCGMEEHVHTDDCYTEELVCGYEEGEPEDPDSAFSVDSEPTTEEPEAEPEEPEPEETEPEVHHHTADCYETVLVEHKELTCGQEEHVHDETCPVDPDTGDFLCGFEEHTHTDDCFTTETETEEKLVCGYEEGQVLSDGAADDDGIAALEDTNTATSVAENSSSEAVSEPVLHHHTEACYEKVLTCTIPEHTHTLACLADYSADVETDDDWQKYSVGLSDNWNEALLAVAKEQLGYKESEKNFQTDEALGDIIDVHHYTRYGAFYGNPYADWDVAFIAFCQHYAGIPKTEIPQRLGLEALRADMDAMGFAYLTEGEDAAYEAIPGDVVTYNKNGTADDETIGIVETVGDDSLTVISGAVEGAVAEVTVPFTDVTSTILVDQAYGDYVGEADDRDGSYDDEIAVQPADEMGATAVQTGDTFDKDKAVNLESVCQKGDGKLTVKVQVVGPNGYFIDMPQDYKVKVGDKVKFTIDFKATEGDFVDSEGKFQKYAYYQFENLGLFDSLNGQNITDPSTGKVLGKFSVDQSGLVKITWDEKALDLDKAFDAHFELEAEASLSGSDDEKTITFPGTNNTITIRKESDAAIDKKAVNDNQILSDDKGPYIEYEVVVSTTKGTFTTVDISDAFDSWNDLRGNYDKTSFELKKSDGSTIDLSKYTFDVDNTIEANGKQEQSFKIVGLPKLSAGESYTLKYKYRLDKDKCTNQKLSGRLTNNAKVEYDGKNKTSQESKNFGTPSDAKIEKTGSDFVEEDKDGSFLRFTIKVTTDKGTLGTVDILDVIGKDNALKGTYDKGSFVLTGPNETIDLTEYKDFVIDNKSGSQNFVIKNLPELKAGQNYTLTYKYRLDKDTSKDGKLVGYFRNDATVQYDDKTDKDEFENTYSSILWKKGTYNNKTEQITWEVVVRNQNKKHLNGYTVKDILTNTNAKIVGNIEVTSGKTEDNITTAYDTITTANGKNRFEYTFSKQPDDEEFYKFTYMTTGNPGDKNRAELWGPDGTGTGTGGSKVDEVPDVPAGGGSRGNWFGKRPTGNKGKLNTTDDAKQITLNWWATYLMDESNEDYKAKKFTLVDTFAEPVNADGTTLNGQNYAILGKLDKQLKTGITAYMTDGLGEQSYDKTVEKGVTFAFTYYDDHGQPITDENAKVRSFKVTVDWSGSNYKLYQISLCKEYSPYTTYIDNPTKMNDFKQWTISNRLTNGKDTTFGEYTYTKEKEPDKEQSLKKFSGKGSHWFSANANLSYGELEKDEDGNRVFWYKLFLENASDSTFEVTDKLPDGVAFTGDYIVGLSNSANDDAGQSSLTVLTKKPAPWGGGAEVDDLTGGKYVSVEENGQTVTFNLKNMNDFDLAKYKGIMILFKVKITDSFWDDARNTEKPYHNEAWWGAGRPAKTDTKITRYEEYVDKTGSQKRNAENDNINEVTYTVTINKDAKQLLPRDSDLELIDRFTVPKDVTATLDRDSVKLTDASGNDAMEKLISFEDASAPSGTGTEYSMTFKVRYEANNPKMYKLTYKYTIDTSKTKANEKEFTLKNSVELFGKVKYASDVRYQKITGSGTAHQEGESTLTLLKVQKGLTNKTLKGAKFGLYRYGDSKWIEVNTTGLVTDSNGKLIFDTMAGKGNAQVEEGKLYKLVETEAPSGYVKSDKAYYFIMMPNGQTDTEAVYKMAAGTDGLVGEMTQQEKDSIIYAKYDADTSLQVENASSQVSVEKQWLDENGKAMTDADKPSSVIVHLYRYAKDNTWPEGKDESFVETAELSKTNSWSYTFTGLQEGYYYVIQEDPNAAYHVMYATVDGRNDNTRLENGDKVTITNQKRTTSLEVVKLWQDSDGNPLTENLPTEITLILYEKGTNQEKTRGKVKPDAEGNWKYTFTDLDPDAQYYVVEEVSVDGYTVSYTNDADLPAAPGDTITVTNRKNAPGYELPATGSTGTAPYTTAGAVLMGAALVGGYRRKRRQERRGE